MLVKLSYSFLLVIISFGLSCGQAGTSDDTSGSGGETETIVVKKKKVVSSSVISPVGGGSSVSDFVSDSDEKGVNFLHTYYQSRNVIKVDLESTFVAGYSHLTTHNLTTGQALISNEMLAEIFTPAKSYSFGIDKLGRVSVEFYPKNLNFRSLLTYGDNDITIEVTDGNVDHFAQQTIVIKDFDVFGGSSMGFSGDIQEKEKFQGWLNPYSHNKVSRDGTNLVTGLPNIVNFQ